MHFSGYIFMRSTDIDKNLSTEPMPAERSGAIQPLRLIDALHILQTRVSPDARPLNAFLVCGFTPLHLKTFLSAYLQLAFRDRRIQIECGLYGDFLGNIERAQTASGTVVIVLEWPDLDQRLGIRSATMPHPAWQDIRDSASKQLHRIQHLIERFLDGKSVVLSLPSLTPRTIDIYPGWKIGQLDAALSKYISDFAAWATDRKHIKVVNSRYLDELSPTRTRWNVSSDIASGFPYHLNHASVLSDLLSRLIRPPAVKKGLITDLDDTLWNGIVGDVGIDGISWTLEQRTHIHAIYQQFLSASADAGVLIGIASKNDPEIVQQAFRRSDLLIDSSRIFPMEISWARKSTGIKRILQAWNIGPDSVVFIDDSSTEIAEVQSVFPEMECIRFPKNDASGLVSMVKRLGDLFGKEFTSPEDSLRLDSIRAQWEGRISTPDGGASLDDFLQSAEAEITFSATINLDDSRPLDLINKTNQFNLNGRRYSDAEWAACLNDSDRMVLVAAYKDKYGQLGEISVLGAHTESNNDLIVDTWVMSCRAFGRRIEYQFLQRLFEKSGKTDIGFDFEPTSRNMPLQEFLSSVLGSTPTRGVRLPYAVFRRNCPPLFQTIKEK
jgi:FkbH-like protein